MQGLAGAAIFSDAVSVGTSDQLPPTEYDERGVDVSLVRWMLSLTPAERLQVLQEHVDEIQQIREFNGSG